MVVVAPVACHRPSLGLCANISSVTVSPLTASVTFSVPLVTPAAQLSVMLVIVCGPVTWAPAPDESGLPMVPKPISANPPMATAMPVSRAATRRPACARTA